MSEHDLPNLIPIKCLGKRIIVDIFDRGERKTPGGLILMDDDFKEGGVRPRQALVLSAGPDARDDGVVPGKTVLLEHGGWNHNHGLTSRETLTGIEHKIWMSELKFVLGFVE